MIPNRPDDRDSAHFPKIQGGEPYHSLRHDLKN